jgi:hypothetical protein
MKGIQGRTAKVNMRDYFTIEQVQTKDHDLVLAFIEQKPALKKFVEQVMTCVESGIALMAYDQDDKVKKISSLMATTNSPLPKPNQVSQESPPLCPIQIATSTLYKPDLEEFFPDVNGTMLLVFTKMIAGKYGALPVISPQTPIQKALTEMGDAVANTLAHLPPELAAQKPISAHVLEDFGVQHLYKKIPGSDLWLADGTAL